MPWLAGAALLVKLLPTLLLHTPHWVLLLCGIGMHVLVDYHLAPKLRALQHLQAAVPRRLIRYISGDVVSHTCEASATATGAICNVNSSWAAAGFRTADRDLQKLREAQRIREK